MHFSVTPINIILTLFITLPSLISSSPLLSARTTSKPDWTLSNISTWTGVTGSPQASYIDFIFRDDRKAFPLTTDCRRVILPSDGGSISDNNFYPCSNDTVGFQFSKGAFQIMRTYIDPSVGPPGEDEVTAAGGATGNLTTDKRPCGVQQTLQTLNIDIMSLVAK